jgi:hypothetical protein
MKFLSTLFALAILSATASAQTIKALGYDTASGEVVANTGTNALTFTNEEVYFSEYFSIQEGILKWEGNPRISTEEMGLFDNSENIRLSWGNDTNGVEVDLLRTAGPIEFTGDEAATNAAITRTNLGLGGGVITNIDVLVSGGGTNTLQFSNGILTNVTTP